MNKKLLTLELCPSKKLLSHFIMTLVVSLLLSGRVYAQQQMDILVCLGLEEKYFHEKKITGPRYNLNQVFINEISAIKDVRLSRAPLTDICQAGDGNVSLSLLIGLLTEREKIFNLRRQADETPHFFEMRKNTIQTLLDDSPHIFFRYIAELQSQTPFPHCLTTKIPELNYFTEQIKYLEGDIPIEQIVKDKRKFLAIFNKLKNYDQFFQECQVLQKELDIKRGRKTAP